MFPPSFPGVPWTTPLVMLMLSLASTGQNSDNSGGTIPVQTPIQDRSGKIVYQRSVDPVGYSGLAIANGDGSGIKHIPNTMSCDFCLSLNRDRTKMVFMSTRPSGFGADTAIYSMNVDGSGLKLLTKRGSDDSQPAWSPDGRRVVFTSQRDNGLNEIYIMNADGTGVRRLTNNNFLEVGPEFSPEESRVIFASDDGIYIIDLSTGRVSLLISAKKWHLQGTANPSYSPDGKRIVFAAAKSATNFERSDIYIANSDGSGVRQLTTLTGDKNYPTFSPTGRRVAFSLSLSEPYKIWIGVINIDGSGQGILIRNAIDADWK